MWLVGAPYLQFSRPSLALSDRLTQCDMDIRLNLIKEALWARKFPPGDTLTLTSLTSAWNSVYDTVLEPRLQSHDCPHTSNQQSTTFSASTTQNNLIVFSQRHRNVQILACIILYPCIEYIPVVFPGCMSQTAGSREAGTRWSRRVLQGLQNNTP